MRTGSGKRSPPSGDAGENVHALYTAAREGLRLPPNRSRKKASNTISLVISNEMNAALEHWLRSQPKPRPGKARAIKIALREWLEGLGLLEPLPDGERLSPPMRDNSIAATHTEFAGHVDPVSQTAADEATSAVSKSAPVEKIKNDAVSGIIVDGTRPVAMIRNGEVFAGADERVGFVRSGHICALNGERLASMQALISGYALSERAQKLLKL